MDASSVCFEVNDESREELCNNRERTIGCRVCLRSIPCVHMESIAIDRLTNAPWKRLNRNIALIKSIFVEFKLHFNSKYIFD